MNRTKRMSVRFSYRPIANEGREPKMSTTRLRSFLRHAPNSAGWLIIRSGNQFSTKAWAAGAASLLAFVMMQSPALALPPAPANDEQANAEVISPALPQLILGTTVLANDSINTLPDIPAITSFVDGPDVFYSFTPDSTDSYRIQLNPWQYAPLRSSDRQFTVYVLDAATNGAIDGIRAPGSARPLSLDVALDGGIEYLIGVDHNSATHDNFEFTLLVDRVHGGDVDNCLSADIDITTNTLPIVVLNDIDGAANDFAFTQSADRCAVSGTPTPAAGIDHVYLYTAPADGEYAIDLIGSGFDAVVYVDDSCDPFFLDGCMGAANHSTGGTSGGKHELVVVTLEMNKDYYIFVDNASTTTNSGFYALIIDDAFTYEINELEPNDSSGTATAVTTPLNGGQLVGPTDEDWWSVTGSEGDRVYAWANNGGSSNSTLDTDLGFYSVDGTTLIEFDDEDGDGADAPIEDLRFIYSTSSPVIAGAQMDTNGTHYLRVTDQSATGTVHRYRFHVGVEPATRNPLGECEPNDSFAAADRTGKDFFAGAITTDGEVDFYSFEATTGDRVFIALDGDPERDSDGSQSASTNSNGFHGQLVIYDPAQDILISDVSDSNTVQFAPDYPAQGGFFIARSNGTHYVEVRQQSATGVGPDETYNLAIFKNDAAPALAEEIDPILVLTPDFPNDEIDLDITDNAVGDSGICAVTLADNTNLQVTGAFTPGDPSTSLTIELVNINTSGSAKLFVDDCAGNTACAVVAIDIDGPDCMGFNFASRNPQSMHEPIHVPDNSSPDGTTNGTIEIADAGLLTDVNVTVSINALDTGDIDLFLISPSGTSVELVTDRGSSLGIDFTNTTFDDDATEIVSISSSDAPYTGVWLPEDPGGLALLNGEQAQGTWKLRVVDDASSESFGATLVQWSLDIKATFAGPEQFDGTVTDFGDGGGISSIVLASGTNTQLDVSPSFVPGDQSATYLVSLIDPSTNGTATVTVTDLSSNTCDSVINLSGAPDVTSPANTGSVTQALTFKQEVQQVVPSADLIGVTSTINVPDSFKVAEVELAFMLDAEDQGRMAARLTHGGAEAILINRVGQDDRSAAGNTKASFDVVFDDDAPASRDIHDEVALGSESTLGIYQSDGRGDFFGDGITSDPRDNMLFVFDGAQAFGDWDLQVIDGRFIGTSDNIFRRWSMTLINSCGPEFFVGTAKDVEPGTGIDTIEPAIGSVNLVVVASFTPGDAVVDYRVELINTSAPGSGDIEITDGAGNVTVVPVALAASSGDDNEPVLSGSVVSGEFNGSATELQSGDTGIASVELAPYADNLILDSVSPDPPNGATSVGFVVALDATTNGRGYVRVTDDCGRRSHILVEIDGTDPICSGSVGSTKRYISNDLPQAIPDNSAGGVASSIIVPDIDIISDVNITFNITHPFDDDIDMTLIDPVVLPLFGDLGSTGNDFRDTTLDDEAAAPIPDSSTEAPFTGSYQPQGGPALNILDGNPAVGTYTLRVADDKVNDTGTFDSWSITIESATFEDRYDGRAEDSELLASGICDISLAGGATNLVLTVDPFTSGDAIVRYSVDIAPGQCGGNGVVDVTDCAGNVCATPISLGFNLKGDLDKNGMVDGGDVQGFVDCVMGPTVTQSGCACYAADMNDDDVVDLLDYAEFIKLF